MSKITKLIKAHTLAYKGDFTLLDELTHPKFRGYDPRVNTWVNHEESKILISTVGKEILVGKSRVIFENEEFLCFEVFRKFLNIDFIATIVAVKYKDNKVIEIESLNEELNQDPSDGQDWNWEDYEKFGLRWKVSQKGESMANALVGKTSVTYVWIVPTQEGVDALRNFFDDHANFMGVKSYQHGPLRLIHYFISEGPEWVDHDPIFKGKYPEKTGRTVFTLTEIYETDDGLFHHCIESNDFRPEFAEIASAHKITGYSFSHLKVTHSLWD